MAIVLLLCMAISVPAESAELRATDRNHFSSGAKKRPRGTFGGQGRKYRTRILQAPKKGLMASDPNPLYQAAAFDKEASVAVSYTHLTLPTNREV